MPTAPAFDLAAAHKYFAADCFNKAWDLLEKQERTGHSFNQNRWGMMRSWTPVHRDPAVVPHRCCGSFAAQTPPVLSSAFCRWHQGAHSR